MATADYDIIETFFYIFKNNSKTIIERLQPTCLNVIFSLMVIDLTLEVLLDEGEENIFLKLIKKTMLYGIFITAIVNYHTIVNTYLLSGFIQLGNYVSTGIPSTSFITSPGGFLSDAMFWIGGIFSFGGIGVIALDKLGIETIPMGLMLTGLWLIGTYIAITCTAIMCFVRYFIVTSLAVIILPFGVLKETSNIGRNIISLFLKQGTKIMLMIIVLNFMNGYIQFEGDIVTTKVLIYICQGIIWLALMQEVPSIAEEIFGGHLGGGKMSGKGISNFAKGEVGEYYKNSKKNNGSLTQGIRNTYKSLMSKL